MLIFINADQAYQHWISHHHPGFVLDGRHGVVPRDFVLHRATCSAVKLPPDHRVHCTTAGRFKACSLEVDELQSWALEQTCKVAIDCEQCQPSAHAANDSPPPIHITKLAAQVLDYILESAAIHLDNEPLPYRLTIGDVAACFAKTPGQLAASLSQLAAGGWIEVAGKSPKNAAFGIRQAVFPTVAALKTLPAFHETSDGELANELNKLKVR